MSPSGIGVAVVGALPARAGGPPRMSCRISDGALSAWLEIEPTDARLTPARLESQLERWAETLPPDGRLLSLEALSPLAFPPAA